MPKGRGSGVGSGRGVFLSKWAITVFVHRGTTAS
jgi:hypothetical protein